MSKPPPPPSALDALFGIQNTTDPPKTIGEISDGIGMRGYNLWILICSAMLASIGLDTNSVAVIIGAMLISPLMSPILGVGLGLGINDRDLLLRSVKNLSLATAFSLGVSSVYFAFSPLSEITPELLARTHPNLLDVLVALFGGIAGIVAGSRHDKTNAIPGVAIATALMPPICTAGFGIAHADWRVFVGAFYLFCINAVFISLATYGVVKYLNFPQRRYSNPRTGRHVATLISLMLLVTTVPSGYFLYTVYRNLREKRSIEREIISRVAAGGNEVLKWDIVRKAATAPQVKVYYSGSRLDDAQREDFHKRLEVDGLGHYQVSFHRMNMTREEVSQMSTEAVQSVLSSLAAQTPPDTTLISPGDLHRELRLLYPAIEQVGLGEMYLTNPKTAVPDTLTSVAIRWNANSKLKPADVQKLTAFLKVRLKKDSVLVQSF